MLLMARLNLRTCWASRRLLQQVSLACQSTMQSTQANHWDGLKGYHQDNTKPVH